MPKAFSEGRPGMVRGFNGGWSLKPLPDDAARDRGQSDLTL